MEHRSSSDVDSLGDFRIEPSDQLKAEESTGRAVTGVAHRDALATGVIGLVIVCFGSHCDRFETRDRRLTVPNPRSCRHDVEDFDDLCPKAPSEAVLGP